HGVDAAAPRAPGIFRPRGEVSTGATGKGHSESKMTMGGGGKMPTRLVDAAAEDADTAEAWAVDLLRGAEPYRAPAGRKQRVQLRLGRAGKRSRRLFLRPALVGVVMFSCGAIASSAFGPWPAWVVDAYHRVVGHAPPPAPVPASEARAHRLR